MIEIRSLVSYDYDYVKINLITVLCSLGSHHDLFLWRKLGGVGSAEARTPPFHGYAVGAGWEAGVPCQRRSSMGLAVEEFGGGDREGVFFGAEDVGTGGNVGIELHCVASHRAEGIG